jgi:hypothetical protein
LTFGQSSQYISCGKYSNLSPCKVSHLSEVPKYFSYFYFSHVDFFNSEKELNIGKRIVGRFLQAGLFPQHSQPSPFLQTSPRHFIPRVAGKRAPAPCGSSVSASLLRGREPLRKPTHLCLLGQGNPSAFPCSSLHHPPMKFWPCPMPRCSVQATAGCPVASPRLLAAVKPYCPLALLLPPLRLYTTVAAPGASAMPWTRRWEPSLG